MIEPEDDGCGDADGGHEGVGASVVAGCDASPVLELGEQVLDLVALSIEGLVVVEGGLRLRLDGMQGSMPLASSSSRNHVLSYPRSAIR